MAVTAVYASGAGYMLRTKSLNILSETLHRRIRRRSAVQSVRAEEHGACRQIK